MKATLIISFLFLTIFSNCSNKEDESEKPKGVEIEVDIPSILVPSEGGSYTVNLLNFTHWRISTIKIYYGEEDPIYIYGNEIRNKEVINREWFSLGCAVNSNVLTCTIEPNTTGESRKIIVGMMVGNYSKDIEISQEK